MASSLAAAAASFLEERGTRNDLIIADGFPALNTFKPPTGKSTGDEEFSATKDDPIPRYPFASFPSSLNIQTSFRKKFLADCERAFTARAKESDEAYSAGATFFVPAEMTPRCALEGLALDIFKAHTMGLIQGKDYDAARSGAEWWTLVLESGSREANGDKNPAAKKKDDDDSDEEEEDDEVGMHFDADYGLEAQLPNYMLHPRVATITYLSDCGVPTLILDKVSPPPDDVSKNSLNGDISTGWLSHPQFGKHVAFDGRLLHGAPGTFFPAVPETDYHTMKRRKLDRGQKKPVQSSPVAPGKRVTFLVNVWLNHCPIDADLLDAEEAYAMQMPLEEKDWRSLIGLNPVDRPLEFKLKPEPEKVQSLELDLPNGKGEEGAGTDECVLCDHEVDMVFGASMDMCHVISTAASSCQGGSAQIQFHPGALKLVVGKEVEESDDEE